MFGLGNLFAQTSAQKFYISRDRIAEILRVSPDALDAFEKAYSKAALQTEPESIFEVNSRQAAAKNERLGDDSPEELKALTERIVKELIWQTLTYTYDGKTGKIEKSLSNAPEKNAPVTNQDLLRIPASLRPQLSGELMKRDLDITASAVFLFYYDKMQNGKTPKDRRDAYNRFRQGLDILDLDALAYRIIGQNRNSIGHWFPELVSAYRDSGFFQIPATTIAKVPLTLLQLTRLDYHSLTPSTIQIVDNWAHAVFRLNDERDYFVKTGTYSSKFDFRNCLVHGEKEVRELGEYLLYIHHQALQMAGPLSFPCIYGVSTTNEWVVREFIPDKEGNPCIYHGLPLHTEYRVFVDCDSDAVIGVSPYWEPKTMLNRFGSCSDANSPHQMHDYVIFKSHEATLMRRYHENVDSVVEHIREFLPALDLQGQWSIDVMQNGDDFWIIDMAVAENSAFYDCVPESLRRPSAENWIPDILKPNN